MQKSYYLVIYRCWHDLLSRLFLAAFITYTLIVFLSYIGVVNPYDILGLTTAGLRHVGVPLVNYGASLGLPAAIGIFLCNTSVALLIISVLTLTLCYNPHRWPGYPPLIRRSFERDATADRLRFLPGCRRITNPRLRIAGFCLNFTPVMVMIFFGMMIGGMVASGQYVFGSLQAVLALIAPHGVLEVPSLVLAAAIPYSGYHLIQSDLRQGRVVKVFRSLENFHGSRHIQLCLTIVISLLWVAGVIEASLSA